MNVASGLHPCPATVKGFYSGDALFVGAISSVDLVFDQLFESWTDGSAVKMLVMQT